MELWNASMMCCTRVRGCGGVRRNKQLRGWNLLAEATWLRAKEENVVDDADVLPRCSRK
jgi:hypothetical protein